MAGRRVVVVGAGVGGLCAALELRRHGFDVVVLERHAEVGGKAAERREGGFRWDRGPSIVVMPWVYWSLFEANGLDPEAYLPLRRLDPAFRVRLTDERWLDIPSDIEGVREAFGQIDPEAPRGLDRFLERTDRFARRIGHAYCDRILDRWSQVMLSRLLVSAAVISPSTSYKSVIDRDFRSAGIRELLYGFPTYSGFDPVSAPGSLAIIPWTILREGVWYPERGGIAEIPRAIARACRDRGVEIRTGVEVEEISVGADGAVSGVNTANGHLEAAAVVSNSDYVHTFRMLNGGKGFSPEVEALREGRAEPSESFFTIEMGCDRKWDRLAHHMLVLTSGSDRVYEELFERGEYPSDPPLYLNVTSETDAGDAPEGGSNPFLVVGAPPQKREGETDPEFEARYAEQLLERLEQVGLSGLRASVKHARGEWSGGLEDPLPRLPRRDLRPGQVAQHPGRQFSPAELPDGHRRPVPGWRRRSAGSRVANGRPKRQADSGPGGGRPGETVKMVAWSHFRRRCVSETHPTMRTSTPETPLMKRMRGLVLSTIVACLWSGGEASAREELWRQDSSSAFAKGKTRHVVVSDSGVIRLGRAVTQVGRLEEAHVWDLARSPQGSLYAATGDHGRVYRLQEDGAWKEVLKVDDTQVLSLATRPDGGFFAGTGPGGHVIEWKDKTLSDVKIHQDVQYVWDLALDRQGTLWAATGPSGQLWKRPKGGEWTRSSRQRNRTCSAWPRRPTGRSTPAAMARG